MLATDTLMEHTCTKMSRRWERQLTKKLLLVLLKGTQVLNQSRCDDFVFKFFADPKSF